MLLGTIFAQRLTCNFDMLSAVITLFTSINFVKFYKIRIPCGHFRDQKIYNWIGVGKGK